MACAVSTRTQWLIELLSDTITWKERHWQNTIFPHYYLPKANQQYTFVIWWVIQRIQITNISKTNSGFTIQHVLFFNESSYQMLLIQSFFMGTMLVISINYFNIYIWKYSILMPANFWKYFETWIIEIMISNHYWSSWRWGHNLCSMSWAGISW